MSFLDFEWDEVKNRSNQRKHGISFEEARTVFFDEHARVFDDPDHSDEEERFILLGMSLNARILIVCHCYRSADSRIRIVSARKAEKREQRAYGGKS